jgi:hypothetical protein
VDWNDVDKFTPELYEEYIRAPAWELDGEFVDEQEQNQYMGDFVKQLVQQSKAKTARWVKGARRDIETLETLTEGTVGVFDLAGSLAAQPIPFARAHIKEQVALLSNNPPIPTVVALQESQQPYVNALNQIIAVILKQSKYPVMTFNGHYDIRFYNATCFKTSIDPFRRGPFNQEGRICINKCDFRNLALDPDARVMHWSDMDYIIETHEMEIGEIRSQYPLRGFLVDPEETELTDMATPSFYDQGDYIQSPQPKLAKDLVLRKQKIPVYECWLKDSRLKFVPNTTSAPYELDDDGHLVGNFKMRFPDGRLIIVAGGVVLKDIPNPYAHGQFPYIFAQGSPNATPFTLGDAADIMTVTRKINDILKRIHKYAQSEIERPIVGDEGAIADPNIRESIPNTSDYFLELTQGAQIHRMEPTDIPTFVMPYVASLQAALDLVSGSSTIMKGILPPGAQLGGDTVDQMKQQASARMATEVQYWNAAVEELGYQLAWLCRQTMDENIKITTLLPDGTPETIDWKSDRKIFERGDPNEIARLRAQEDYLVEIKAGTGEPNGKEGQDARLKDMFRLNAIDRQAYLDGIEFSGRQNILPRMRQKEIEDITAMGAAKQIGVGLRNEIKKTEPKKNPGK